MALFSSKRSLIFNITSEEYREEYREKYSEFKLTGIEVKFSNLKEFSNLIMLVIHRRCASGADAPCPPVLPLLLQPRARPTRPALLSACAAAALFGRASVRQNDSMPATLVLARSHGGCRVAHSVLAVRLGVVIT